MSTLAANRFLGLFGPRAPLPPQPTMHRQTTPRRIEARQTWRFTPRQPVSQLERGSVRTPPPQPCFPRSRAITRCKFISRNRPYASGWYSNRRADFWRSRWRRGASLGRKSSRPEGCLGDRPPMHRGSLRTLFCPLFSRGAKSAVECVGNSDTNADHRVQHSSNASNAVRPILANERRGWPRPPSGPFIRLFGPLV